MRRCESDLASNGIEIGCLRPVAMRLLVREHLDYFRMMLGFDARPGEVIALAKRLPGRPHPRRVVRRVAGATVIAAG